MEVFAVIILLILIIIVSTFWMSSNIISMFSGIHFVPSPKQIINRSLELANLKKGEKYLELGSGIGSGLLFAANNFGANATGVEVSPFYYLISKLRIIGKSNIKNIRKDFRKVDFSGYNVVYCYLCTKLMKELYPKFKKELPRGARVVSYCFEIPNIKPTKIEIIKSKNIFLYEF